MASNKPDHLDFFGSVMELANYLVVPTFVLDRNGYVAVWNHACARLTGCSAGEMVGTTNHWKAFYDEERLCLADLLLKKRTSHAISLYAAHSDALHTTDGFFAENWCVMPRSNVRRYLAIDAGLLIRNGEIFGAIESVRDLTAQKLAEEALAALASRDGLTDIANRRHFDERLWKTLQ